MNFFWELYTEEIPSGYQQNAILHWQKQLEKLLKENSISFEKITVQGTSRRLVCFGNISLLQSVVEEELKGPPKNICFDENNNATQALIGFAKKVALPEKQIEFKNFGEAEYAFAIIKTGGRKTEEILPSLFEKIIQTTRFPRQMRWAELSFSYARPILGYYGYLMNLSLQFRGGIWDIIKPLSGIQGHQILHSEYKELKTFAQYQKFLHGCGIILDHNARKQKIQDLLQTTASSLNLQLVVSHELLNEVNFLVEIPSVVVGEFPKFFLDLPEDVIISEMADHQRYFALRKKDGSLSEKFCIVSNANTSEKQAYQNIKEGNERVLKARLSDGKFFFDEDRKIPLENFVENLKTVVFQEHLGNMFDKKERMKQIALTIATYAPFDFSKDSLLRAGDLCKADLTTQLVYEFDSLQGAIGSVYARLDGEEEAVSLAIFEHYLPKFQGDALPQNSLGALLSLADKLDNIVSGFLLNKAPTASQDPLALRRQCLYFIEILIDQKISFSIDGLLQKLKELYPLPLTKNFELTVEKIVDFIKGRLITIFHKGGFELFTIRAALNTNQTNILQLYYRLAALKNLQEDENFKEMLLAFKRMNNIVQKAQIEDSSPLDNVSLSLMETEEEKQLFSFAQILQDESLMLNKEEATIADYQRFFSGIARAKTMVDQFFDNVMVNHENQKIRENRISLLFHIVSTVEQVLAISELQS